MKVAISQNWYFDTIHCSYGLYRMSAPVLWARSHIGVHFFLPERAFVGDRIDPENRRSHKQWLEQFRTHIFDAMRITDPT